MRPRPWGVGPPAIHWNRRSRPCADVATAALWPYIPMNQRHGCQQADRRGTVALPSLSSHGDQRAAATHFRATSGNLGAPGCAGYDDIRKRPGVNAPNLPPIPAGAVETAPALLQIPNSLSQPGQAADDPSPETGRQRPSGAGLPGGHRDLESAPSGQSPTALRNASPWAGRPLPTGSIHSDADARRTLRPTAGSGSGRHYSFVVPNDQAMTWPPERIARHDPLMGGGGRRR